MPAIFLIHHRSFSDPYAVEPRGGKESFGVHPTLQIYTFTILLALPVREPDLHLNGFIFVLISARESFISRKIIFAVVLIKRPEIEKEISYWGYGCVPSVNAYRSLARVKPHCDSHLIQSPSFAFSSINCGLGVWTRDSLMINRCDDLIWPYL